jgi:hypothetical protein
MLPDPGACSSTTPRGGEVDILFGISLIVASALALYLALPSGGRVVRFLRSDAAQSYYVVALLAAFVAGALIVVVSLTGFDSGYQ